MDGCDNVSAGGRLEAGWGNLWYYCIPLTRAESTEKTKGAIEVCTYMKVCVCVTNLDISGIILIIICIMPQLPYINSIALYI